MARSPHIVGIGGTTRPRSSTEKAVAFALRVCEKAGATTAVFTGHDLAELPLYAPEKSDRTDGARRFVDEIKRADGLIVGSPGYHGSVSGLVKNALDYTEDLRDEGRPYFSDRAVGCVATGAGWQGVVSTLEHLRTIVHALRGWPTPLGAALNTTEDIFGADGDVTDERAIFQLTTVAEEVLSFAEGRIRALESA